MSAEASVASPSGLPVSALVLIGVVIVLLWLAICALARMAAPPRERSAGGRSLWWSRLGWGVFVASGVWAVPVALGDGRWRVGVDRFGEVVVPVPLPTSSRLVLFALGSSFIVFGVLVTGLTEGSRR